MRRSTDKYINPRAILIPMEVAIQEDTSGRIDEASQVLGIEKDELIDRAILSYLDSLEKILALKKEMREWDALSDEALANFEKAL